MNLGLRYEYDQPVYEVQNRIANIDLTNKTVLLAAVGGNSRSLYKPTYTQIDPRFGFAYQVNNRLVVRGGFSSVTFMDFNALTHAANPPFSTQSSATATAPSAAFGGSPVSPSAGFTGSAVAATSYTAWTNLKPAFVLSFDLAVEYQLSNTSSLMAAYVGNVGSRLLDQRAGNQWTTTNVAASAPFYNLVGSSGSVTIYESESNQNYNGGEVIYRKRSGHGLSFTANYTFAKNLTNSTGPATPSNISGGSNFPQNAYNLGAEYGPAGFDIRHMLTATWVYELPFSRGKLIGTNANRLVDDVIGGWKISGNATLYSGFPVTIQATNVAGVNQATGRANHYRKLQVRNRKTTNWWGDDPSAGQCLTAGVDNGNCAYGVPAAGTFGNAGVGTERSAGFRGIDMAGSKTLHIASEHMLEFRADAYNVGNISSYNNPGRNVAASTGWGLVQSTRSQQRQIQFSLKYRF